MSTIEYVKSLDSTQFVDWLDKQLKENKHSGLSTDQRENLIDEEINGIAFLGFSDPDKDLKELGFKMGARTIIKNQIIGPLLQPDSAGGSHGDSEDMDMDTSPTIYIEPTMHPPKKQKTGNDTEEQTQSAGSGSKEQAGGSHDDSEDMKYPPFCSADFMPDVSDDSSSAGLSAWTPGNKEWPKGTSELKVWFIQDIPVGWTLGGHALNRSTILKVANIWHEKEPAIPKFIEANSLHDSDIRVQFYTLNAHGTKIYGGNSSLLGTDVKNRQGQATMNLNLSYGDDYNRHVIVHEFGHSLGLGHEHQRSQFWDVASEYIQVAKMYDGIKRLNPMATLTYDQFRIQWGVDKTPGSGTQYDPYSVMHYWFDVEWLEDKYSKYKDLQQVEDDSKLFAFVKKVLRGIHTKVEDLAMVPSKDDIECLKQKYTVTPIIIGRGSKPASAPPGKKSIPGETDIPILATEWDDVLKYWRRIGLADARRLGGVLGLDIVTVGDMRIDELVTEWKKKTDYVLDKYENPHTWNVFHKALKKISQNGTAQDVYNDKICKK